MKRKLCSSAFVKGCISIIAASVIFGFGFTGTGHCQDNESHKTGLRKLSPEQWASERMFMREITKVKLNKMGLERINKARKDKGLPLLSPEEAGVVETGKEIKSSPGAAAAPDASDSGALETIPVAVDNSTLKYFPPIGAQKRQLLRRFQHDLLHNDLYVFLGTGS